MFDSLWQDLKYGARTLLKNPGFTVLALLTLALGIGATSAIFSVFQGVLLRSLPYPEPERVVALWEVNKSGRRSKVTYPNFADWRDAGIRLEGRGLEGLAVYSGYAGPTTVLGGDEPIRSVGVSVSEEFFPVLGVEAFLGRAFLPEESRFGADPAVVISHGFWQRNLGANTDLGSLKLRFWGRSFRVVGVMPPGFAFPAVAEMWVPSELSRPGTSRTAHNWRVVGRLSADADPAALDGHLDELQARILAEYGDDVDATAVEVLSLRDQLVGPVRWPLTLLLGAAFLVLLVAATNLAATLLARAVAREREIAVRAAIGAGRARVARQLLTETVLLTTLGGLAGLGLAAILVRVLRTLRPARLPRLDEIAVDPGVFVFTLVVALLTGLVFGLVPAFHAFRTDLRGALSEGRRHGGQGQVGLWNTLVTAEIALALVLLVSSGLLVKSFWGLVSVDPGFAPGQVLTFGIAASGVEYPDEFTYDAYLPGEQKTAAFYRDFLDVLEGIPGIESAGFISSLPLAGADTNGSVWRDDRPGEKDFLYSSYRVVGGDYFAALDIPLVAGRLFDAREAGGPPAVIVNEEFVARFFPGEEILGRRLRTAGMDLHPDDWMTVVGVVGNVRHRGLAEDPPPEFYVPFEQRAFRATQSTVVVKAAGAAAGVTGALRGRLRELYPEVPVDFTAMETWISRSVERERFMMFLVASFAALALVLAATGWSRIRSPRGRARWGSGSLSERRPAVWSRSLCGAPS